MPNYQVDIEKESGGEYWTNVYHVTAPSMVDATTEALAIANIERAIHYANVNFTKARVRDALAPAYSYGTQVAIGTTGIRSATSVDFNPLWVTLRVEFLPTGERPNRKYLRLPVAESNVLNGVISTTERDFVVTNYTNPMMLRSLLRSAKYTPFASAVVFRPVQMRQLRRGSKRKLLPVL